MAAPPHSGVAGRVEPPARGPLRGAGVTPVMFIDTNVLVKSRVPGAPDHDAARAGLERAFRDPEPLRISRQVMREYLAVVTRPQTWPVSITCQEALDDVSRLIGSFEILEDGPGVTEYLVGLCREVPAGGRQIHDANNLGDHAGAWRAPAADVQRLPDVRVLGVRSGPARRRGPDGPARLLMRRAGWGDHLLALFLAPLFGTFFVVASFGMGAPLFFGAMFLVQAGASAWARALYERRGRSA